MASTKCKLGELIEQSTKRNKDLKIKNIQGVNSSSEFCQTKANTTGLDFGNYKIVKTEQFAYNPSRINLGSIALLEGEDCIVSPMYVVFEVSDKSKLLPQYLMIWFGRKEFQRSTLFYATGSVRDTFGFDAMCDIDISLPPLSVQRKYVDIYNSLSSNQQAYEHGLDDLKLTCDAYIENLRRGMKCEEIGEYICRKNERNINQTIKKVVGLSTKKQFRVAQSRVDREKLSNYKIVEPFNFVFVPTTDTWKVLAAALNDFGEKVVVSPIYEVFSVDTGKLLPEYLMLWFNRTEFDRYARFHSWGSARENFSFGDMCEVKIPIPPIEVQQSIARVYRAYTRRKQINELLKAQLKAVCPVLIKGSVEEA